MVNDITKMSQIYSAIAKSGQGFVFPGVWREAKCDTAFFQLPKDAEDLLSGLRKKFGDELLLKSCVVKNSSSTGEVEFSEFLSQQTSPNWAVASPGQHRTAALVGQMRYFGCRGEVLAAASKSPAKMSGPESHHPKIIVANDMVNLALWKTLGFAAIPGSDWSRLLPGGWRELMQSLSMSLGFEEVAKSSEASPANPPEVNSYGSIAPFRRSIILVNGSLAEMTSNDNANAMTSWKVLQDLHRYFPKAVRDFQLWRPCESLLEPVQLLQRIGKPDCIASHLLKSLERDSISIDPKCADRPSCVDELERALRTWQSSVEVASTPEGPRKAFAQLMATYERLQFRPLIDAAANTDDEVERNLLLSLVEVKRMQLPLVLHTSHSMLQQIRDSGSRSVEAFTPDQFKQVSSLMDREVKLIKEIQSGRQRKPSRTDASSDETIALHSLPNWAYPRRSCAR